MEEFSPAESASLQWVSVSSWREKAARWRLEKELMLTGHASSLQEKGLKNKSALQRCATCLGGSPIYTEPLTTSLLSPNAVFPPSYQKAGRIGYQTTAALETRSLNPCPAGSKGQSCILAVLREYSCKLWSFLQYANKKADLCLSERRVNGMRLWLTVSQLGANRHITAIQVSTINTPGWERAGRSLQNVHERNEYQQ